ncbi:putative reverse transcriptase domain-containing protein [Tanacetum coccineum]|uniref:Reverse transcriptase domain-containing protein n=1 Tax=Tanacetum coccineum TaxID=301880 RepID=A0ABQ5IAC3_9ASTR
MPPLRRLGASRTRGSRRAAMERMIADRVAQAIEDHEKKRASSSNTEGSSSSGGCSHKTYNEGQPHSFNASTFEGRALTWWNGNVRTLGLENANKIPWTEFKEMMTTEYCPDTEIQKMEQELWNLTLKGDDIETYINRFHELSLMCPELVPTENKKIKKFIKGFPERIKGNITSSKPSSLHDAVNMAHETTKVYAAAPVGPTDPKDIQVPTRIVTSVIGTTWVHVPRCVLGVESVVMKKRTVGLEWSMVDHKKWNVGDVVARDIPRTTVQRLGMCRITELEMDMGVFAQCELQFEVHEKLVEVFQFEVVLLEVHKHLVVK